MKPTQPQERDCIPREVATAMLTEPRARLTNRMRKNCMAAREKVFASTSPIKLAVEGETDFPDGYGYTQTDPRSQEEKTKRRFSYASLQQLGRWLHRSIARRKVVQRRYLAVPNSDVRAFQARFDAARQALALLAERLDLVRDVCEDELKMRSDKCDEIVAFRRGGRTSVDFLPTCIADMVSSMPAL